MKDQKKLLTLVQCELVPIPLWGSSSKRKIWVWICWNQRWHGGFWKKPKNRFKPKNQNLFKNEKSVFSDLTSGDLRFRTQDLQHGSLRLTHSTTGLIYIA